jgi:small-conductance mechanosensitive channel
MKRGLLILAFGVLAAAAAYGCIYFACTASARSMERSAKPELAWLKEEFNLSDAEFQQVSELHTAYLPDCEAMCRQIDAQNLRLKNLLAATNQVTAEIETAIAESANLRGECQRQMLEHFYEVSRTMSPEQGQLYLTWVRDKIFLSDYGMKQ